MTKQIKNVLFVCTGNICRSPFAEGLFNSLAAQKGLKDVAGDSAGLLALPGNSATHLAQQVADEYAVDLAGHRAKSVSGHLVDWSNLVLAMEKVQVDSLANAFPEARGKVLLLRHFGRFGSRRRDIADPYGLQYEAYRFCFLDIEDSIAGLVDYLSHRLVPFEPIDVTCYEGYKAKESPRSFVWQGREFTITDIVDRWYESSRDETSRVTDYYKVKTDAGDTYIIRYNRRFDRWAILTAS